MSDTDAFDEDNEGVRSLDDLPPWIVPYLAGVVDNHFNLLLRISKSDRRTVGYKPQPSIRYKAEGKAIIDLLERYCAALDIAPRVYEKSETKYPHYRFVISRRDDLEAFLTPLRPYCVGQAEPISLLLDEILPAMERGDHSDEETFLEFMEHADAFRDAAGRANRSKYDLEYFEREWDVSAE